MSKYICIHGHFYQPPRENPWTGRVPVHESAFPFRDWNERITEECYRPNLSVSIRKDKTYTINNYSKMSYNFGPTLLKWLYKNAQDVYSGILKADKEGREYFSGHGPAIAQVYNHVIMPLVSRRDKETEVYWGIKDFEYRFGRKPEGMWLPEMAVDLETLDILALNGIKFTILSQRQAGRIRRSGDTNWTDVKDGKIDSFIPYFISLPSGRKITIFFRNDDLSDEVAFGDLLKNGERFGERLLSMFSGGGDNRIVTIALDGETFGHHHKFGEIALAYCLFYIESKNEAKLTVLGEYLEKNPPQVEVEIIENSSWSCPHGVDRWRSNCGCMTGEFPEFNQEWRSPLRSAMEYLKANVDAIFDDEGSKIFRDPWKARNNYIEIILNESEEILNRFLKDNIKVKPTKEKKLRALKLLEMQYYSMLCFTSCGWFFDDVSRIETRQNMTFALKTMELARLLTGIELEKEFLKILARAKSNYKNLGDGAKIFRQFVVSGIEIKEQLKHPVEVSRSIPKLPLLKRGAGILLHISSLPGPYGIGELGPEAYRFVDLLKKLKLSCWQILPLTEVLPAYFNSPYKSPSAFAGNRLFISTEFLVRDGLINRIEPEASFASGTVNYNAVNEFKSKILNTAYERFKKFKKFRLRFEEFCEENKNWLEDYALFCALKEKHKGKPWYEWDIEVRDFVDSVSDKIRVSLSDFIEREKFIQFLFFNQWSELRQYANQNGIEIIGDIPFYVSYDSVDVWRNSQYFKLDRKKKPLYVSGVPPDYFSKTGQLWGDPVYNWKKLENEGYTWWVERLKHACKLYDIIRLDHFRGFVAYWEIPAGERTAVKGRWVPSPSYDFFIQLFRKIPEIKIIAEDLGTITEDVRELMKYFNIPGMKVLLFAFDDKFPSNPYLPHFYEKNSVVYTGTHDNNTVRGWYEKEASDEEKLRVKFYVNKELTEKEVHHEFVRLALSSPSNIAIIPLQDLLGLGESARMNRPSSSEGNWLWRATEAQLFGSDFDFLGKLVELFGRG